jgi:hypothetical protein
MQSITILDVKSWGTQPFILQGGLLAGSGVTSMHYLGMISVVGVNVTFRPGLVLLSFLLAVFAATAALLMLMFIFEGKLARTLSALVMGVAVCGMHYTGMAATEFRYSGLEPQSSDISNIGVIVAMLAAFACLGMQMMAANQMQNRIKDYAMLKLHSERENVELLRHFLALINFHSRAGCTTSSLEYFMESDIVKHEFGRLEEVKSHHEENGKTSLAEFRELLQHPVTFEVFKDACVKSYNQENATFLAEVHYLLKWQRYDSVPDRIARAVSIYKTYLREDSPRQVNIPSKLQLDAERIFSDDNQLRAEATFQKIERLFRDIEYEVYKLLFNSTFRVGQFHGSAEYKWCKVVLKHLPMPAYDALLKHKEDGSTTNAEENRPEKIEPSDKRDSVFGTHTIELVPAPSSAGSSDPENPHQIV